jgi:hypothetical protein
MRTCMIHMHEHTRYVCVLVHYPILRRREGSLVLVYCSGAYFWNVSSMSFPHAFREEETQGSVKRKGGEGRGRTKVRSESERHRHADTARIRACVSTHTMPGPR